MKKKTKVAITKVSDLGVYKAIKKGLELNGEFRDIIKNKKNVIIKPNTLLANKNATTDSEILRSTIKILKENNIIPKVGDCSGQQKKGETKEVFEKLGYLDIIKQEGVKFSDFEKDPPIKKTIKSNSILKDVFLSKEIYDADFVINLPKIKSHFLTIYTGAIKNIFGVQPGIIKSKVHAKTSNLYKFSSILVDIYASVMPKFTIMDAISPMQGAKGPAFGPTKYLGLIICGSDGLAVDAVSLSLCGINPFKIPMIKIAHERGIGTANLEEIEIVGKKLEDVKTKLRFPNSTIAKLISIGNIFKRILRKIPYLKNKDRCTKCKNCIRVCPVGAIKLEDEIKFDYLKCISCLTCIENCSYFALDTKRAGIKGYFY